MFGQVAAGQADDGAAVRFEHGHGACDVVGDDEAEGRVHGGLPWEVGQRIAMITVFMTSICGRREQPGDLRRA
ncbi:hypothetical protein GCM10009716_16300 [Streptomyces sodiiphilus]|uniref:Uncharacterized protein n=1 Tax=Streptomyces sodiiphilus TaxID=226217 RepID=A0ABN2NZF9_9ACTN